MAQRRSRNRRSSIRKTGNNSGFLNEDTNVYEDNDPLWYDQTVVRPSTSFVFTRNNSSILDPDSTVNVTNLSPNWHKNLSQSNSSKLMAQAVQKTISDGLNNEQSDSSRADPTTESESERESQKRRTNFRAHQAKSNKSEKSNIFLKALEETTESHTKNLKNYTTAQESESEHEYEKKRTRLFKAQKKVDKSEKSNIFLKALEETTDSHSRTLIDQTSKNRESVSTQDESTNNQRLRPKLFQTPKSPTRSSTTVQTSIINESKSIHDEATSNRTLRSKLSQTANKGEASQSKSNRNSLQQSINKSVNEPELANRGKSNIITDVEHQMESAGSSTLNNESDEEDIYEGSFNKDGTSKKVSSAVGGTNNESQDLDLNDESDEENIYDGSFHEDETSKNESQRKSLKRKLETSRSEKLSTMIEGELSQKLRKRNSSHIVNASNKNISTKRTSTINEVQDTSKSLTKSRKRQSQNISEENNSTAAHNSDEENSTMPRYIRRTQSRLFQKSQIIDNEEMSGNVNNESSRIKNNKTQESSKIHEKNSLSKTSNISQNSPSLRKHQSRTTAIPNTNETHESDEENSTMPKYIRRTKSRLFQKSQTANSENAFDEVLNANSAHGRLSKNSEIESTQNSKQTTKSMLRDAMNRSTSLLKPRVVLTRVHNPDSSTESQKENRHVISHAEDSPTNSKQQKSVTVQDSRRDASYSKNSPRKSRTQTTSMDENQGVISHAKNSPRKSRTQKVSVEENQSHDTRSKNSPRKSRTQKVSVEENQSHDTRSKNSQSKLKQVENNETDVSRERKSLRNSKQQAAIEVSGHNSKHTVSLHEESNGQGGSKQDSAKTNERSRSNSHSSVETSSDRTPQQKENDGAQSDSSALPSDELIHTPNPAQSTLKLTGRPFRRLTQMSFRGWEQESIIAPLVPEPALAAALRTRIIAEELEASPQNPVERVPRHPSEALSRPAAETSSQHVKRISLRHSAESLSRESARMSSRHSVETSPQNAAEVPSRKSVRVSAQNAGEGSSRHQAEITAAAPESEDDEIDIMNDSDASHVSDYPLLTRQLNEMPYEDERTTDNEETSPSIRTKRPIADDQNVSTIDKATWAEAIKKTDAMKVLMEAQMKRERERRQQEERQKEQTIAKLKRVMAKKAAEKRKREKKKTVDKAFLVDGKVYKQPKLPRPQKWATDRLYKHLWKCMEPRYGMRTRVKSEQFVLKLAEYAKIFQRRKKYENYEAELEDLLHRMAKLNIITTRYDFYRFCWEYMPFDFRVKVRPMMMPGNERNIPYNPELTNKPILESNDSGDSGTESEPNEAHYSE